MRDERQAWQREWLKPMAVLGAIALSIFALLFSLDHFVTGGDAVEVAKWPFDRYFGFDADHITDAVSALAGMIAAVLGIVITVVSIVVQLSAERYTKVAAMFFRDRTNIVVMAIYVVACVCGIWLSVSLHAHFVPRVTLVATLISTTSGLLLMGPYFTYVFRFLEPANIIARIRGEALTAALTGAESTDDDTIAESQAQTLMSMEELTDITSNSISGRDKIIASNAVDALKDFAVQYVGKKESAKPSWFKIGLELRKNPDFVAMDPESLNDLEDRRTWVEWKVMRQMMGIFNEALGGMRDITYLVAINTRYVGEAAVRANDEQLVKLVLRFMNSYIRAALNARDVRTAYNILNQYRLFVEALIRAGQADAAASAVGHMKYYGGVSFDMQLAFVTETVAYDVGALATLAHDLHSPAEERILSLFLDLDRSPSERGQEQGLKGVRKAQVKLAAYYLASGDEARARRIADDMAGEPPSRLVAIRSELERVTTKDFWEIIDRGRNFEFMPDAQREAMKTFFSWVHVPAPTPSGAISPPPA